MSPVQLCKIVFRVYTYKLVSKAHCILFLVLPTVAYCMLVNSEAFAREVAILLATSKLLTSARLLVQCYEYDYHKEF